MSSSVALQFKGKTALVTGGGRGKWLLYTEQQLFVSWWFRRTHENLAHTKHTSI